MITIYKCMAFSLVQLARNCKIKTACYNFSYKQKLRTIPSFSPFTFMNLEFPLHYS